MHGLPVIVYTDSSALKYIQTMAKPSPRQIRWLHRLQEFDLSIHHIHGKTNIVAGILSRMHEDRKSEELFVPILPIPNIIGSFIAPAHTVLDDWMENYRQDPEDFTYFFNPTTGGSRTTNANTSSTADCGQTTKSLSRKTVSKKSFQHTTTPLLQVTGWYTGP